LSIFDEEGELEMFLDFRNRVEELVAAWDAAKKERKIHKQFWVPDELNVSEELVQEKVEALYDAQPLRVVDVSMRRTEAAKLVLPSWHDNKVFKEKGSQNAEENKLKTAAQYFDAYHLVKKRELLDRDAKEKLERLVRLKASRASRSGHRRNKYDPSKADWCESTPDPAPAHESGSAETSGSNSEAASDGCAVG